MIGVDYFDPRILTGVINKRPRKHTLFTSMFTSRPPSNAELFEVHIVSKGVSMLPAITNHAPGTMRQSNPRSVEIIKAPRFRPKRGFKAADLLKQPAGVNPYNPLDDPLERAIAEDMDMHLEELDYTLEVMCAQATVSGFMDLYDMVDGQRVKTYTVNFKRPATHNVVLSGSKLWGSSGSDLLDQTEEWGSLIQDETNGLVPNELYLGKNAWAAFRKHADVKENLDNLRIEIGTLAPRVGAIKKGHWNGLDVYLVNGTYVDMDGTAKYFLDPDYALLMARGAETIIEYGRPVDLDCHGAVQVFSKLFKQDDPSGIFSLAESRPLPWIRQPGWVVLAKVL